MTHIATLVCDPARFEIDDAVIALAREALPAPAPEQWLDRGVAADLAFDPVGDDPSVVADALRTALDGLAVDCAVLPAANRRKRLLIADMDSTIIGQECVDEVASFAGVGDRVTEITARAMAGELDFAAALRERVALLAGLEESALERAMAERITVNPGAATVVATMRAHRARTMLVSGGFTFFVARVAARVGFDACQANTLVIADGRLTGAVGEPILGRDAKRRALLEACDELAIAPADCAAIGDGANDRALIETAGLGVAYRAKPVLASVADARIDHADLTALLYFQGYERAEFATP